MTNKKGAMTIAEGRYDYKTDVSLILNNGRDRKHFVLRTCLETYAIWKSKYSKNASPFERFLEGARKEAAIVDNEVWVFGVDATNANDIVSAVSIAKERFKVSADNILGDVYVKNLNTEGENDMSRQALIDANKTLYTRVCKAILDAAKVLGCSETIQFWVFSSNINWKIPQQALHESLTEGGATSVETDKSVHLCKVGDNFGGPGQTFKENLHLAVLR
jgi:hypothetical protein